MRRFYTVSTTGARLVHPGDDTQDAITTDFVFRDAADLVVTSFDADGVPTARAITTDYTVSGGGTPPAVGTVTPVSFTPATGENTVIQRLDTLSQGKSFKRQDPLPAANVESALDDTIMRVQELADDLSRVPKAPLTADPVATTAALTTRLKTGTYTGDGSVSQAITGIGFRPLYVKVWRQVLDDDGIGINVFETTDTIIDDNAAGVAVAHTASRHSVEFNAIISLDADGFTVDDGGNDSDPNKDGRIYNYMAAR